MGPSISRPERKPRFRLHGLTVKLDHIMSMWHNDIDKGFLVEHIINIHIIIKSIADNVNYSLGLKWFPDETYYTHTHNSCAR